MKNSNEMKIKHNNGTFWNAENDCWTKNECAATIYSSKNELPDRMGDQGQLVGCFTANFNVIYYDGYGDDAAEIASLYFG